MWFRDYKNIESNLEAKAGGSASWCRFHFIPGNPGSRSEQQRNHRLASASRWEGAEGQEELSVIWSLGGLQSILDESLGT